MAQATTGQANSTLLLFNRRRYVAFLWEAQLCKDQFEKTDPCQYGSKGLGLPIHKMRVADIRVGLSMGTCTGGRRVVSIVKTHCSKRSYMVSRWSSILTAVPKAIALLFNYWKTYFFILFRIINPSTGSSIRLKPKKKKKMNRDN